MNITALALCALVSYLLGSVDFGIVVSRLIYHQDIRKFGSGNAGMTNILRTFGKKAAALTLAGDFLKGTTSVLLARFAFAQLCSLPPVYLAYTAAIGAMLGHLFPVYFGFKGGKGVAVSAGCILALSPWVIVPLVVVFVVVLAVSRIVSLASILAAVTYPVASFWWYTGPGAGQASAAVCTVLSTGMAVLVIFMHRANIRRLLAGTEYKFGQKKQ
ncbi:MAG: glycerol-3-phosphate 1-O-acyltransferase PlsY [Pygmaiobacter massiliensis]|nr:glycerol-3-phosphate 1-O-acyltransferase PlsY [Pygmaiobacter massiliensis]